ncbi:MAG: cation:proton antiporter [Acidimicrobiales bacterium]|nr:cation:proton antiporter [Acidimicrobiales bacterium]
MNAVTDVAFAGLVVAALLAVVRMVRGPSLADRIVAADLLVLILLAGMGVATVRTGSTFFVTAVLVTALVAFVATVTVARYIERRGAR